MDDTAIYANLLYANLVSASPKATYNMANNITLEELEDRYIITISKGVPYARYTTENWGKRSSKSKAEYEAKGLHKERENYRWIEKTIEQTFTSMIGKESVINEL